MPQSANDTTANMHDHTHHNHQLTTSSAISSSSTISSSASDDANAGPFQPLTKRYHQHNGTAGSALAAPDSSSSSASNGVSISVVEHNTLSGMSAEHSAKVSRCFGNTNLCMPQTLLCFKVRLCTW